MVGLILAVLLTGCSGLKIIGAYLKSQRCWSNSVAFSNLSCAPFSESRSCDGIGEVFFDDYDEPWRDENDSAEALFLAAVIDSKRPMLAGYFLDHYSRLGIKYENFLIVFNVESFSDNSNGVTYVKAELHKRRISFVLWVGTFSTGGKHVHMLHMVSTRTRASDWIVWAALDEFHAFPSAMPLFLRNLPRNTTVVHGVLVDRLSASGKLIPVKLGVSIHVQYPLKCRFTLELLGADPTKVIMTRGNVYVSEGNHFVPSLHYFREHGIFIIPSWVDQRSAAFGVWMDIAHFKWTAGAIDYLQSRVKSFREKNVSWWEESSNFVSFNGSLFHYCQSKLSEVSSS
jgi:hypothetical protein